MRIAVIGASGWLGWAITREAQARGHEVTGIARNSKGLADLEGADTRGETAISSGDLAAAMVDELKHPQFSRRRFTVGYTD